jgi:hypothetical protein
MSIQNLLLKIIIQKQSEYYYVIPRLINKLNIPFIYFYKNIYSQNKTINYIDIIMDTLINSKVSDIIAYINDINDELICKIKEFECQNQISLLAEILRKVTHAEFYEIMKILKTKMCENNYNDLIHYYHDILKIPLDKHILVACYETHGFHSTIQLIRDFYGYNCCWIYLPVYPNNQTIHGNYEQNANANANSIN